MPALICAAVALGTLKSIDGIDDQEDNDQADLRDNTYAATGNFNLFFLHRKNFLYKMPVKFNSMLNNWQYSGVVIAVTAVAIIIEVVMIILRFLNIGLINLKIKIFLIIVSLQLQISIPHPSSSNCMYI